MEALHQSIKLRDSRFGGDFQKAVKSEMSVIGVRVTDSHTQMTLSLLLVRSLS